MDAGKRTTWNIAPDGIEETAVLALASPPWGAARLISGVGDIGGFNELKKAFDRLYVMNDTPLYTSKRTARSLWQQYRIYPDRLELQAWILFHTVVVPAGEIRGIEVRPCIFSDGNRVASAMKIDNCDFCRHVLLTKSRGLFKNVGFSPDDPEQFVEICKSILPGH